MTLQIDFSDETELLGDEDTDLIERLLVFAAQEEGVQNSECSITFVSNERIQEINREYRKKDQPTDVISFALEDEGEGEMKVLGGEDMPRALGDIIISVQVAKEQAKEYNHSFSRELGFLALHGFLHLLGYDHMKESDEEVMFGRQNTILEEFGLKRL
ncbi:rRNA maturation RNase YbeY [Jeotgalibacillus proteolyticus]|uniref:Endoribonuclease YbeY n=1 Tax=Jeotgalibacillus proteolyticus TaxID=2082395 RepID=A0A2S5GEN4_9BACL|nr:rRNA maturation RNase YbeY [Jeotgalibacillus proteolyticus]PPA71449.1 rRNA maturation RNase YbeY [Jeotgalibacillus proteolyticus]